MQTELYDEMFIQEDTYWWHVAKRQLVQAEIFKHLLTKNPKVLDVGCGTGAMLEELSPKFKNIYGVDGSSKAVAYCQKRGLTNIKRAQFDKKLPFRKGYFNGLICLDVLEHVADDSLLLGEFNRLLGSRGTLFLTVPAYSSLWTYWDEMLGHKRRYRKGALVKKLQRHGFQVLKSSYFYSFLLPAAVIFRSIKTIAHRHDSDFVTVPNWLNSILMFLCNLERFVIRYISLPVGLSILLVAKK